LWRQTGGEVFGICNVLISAPIYAFEHCYNCYNWFIFEIWNLFETQIQNFNQLFLRNNRLFICIAPLHVWLVSHIDLVDVPLCKSPSGNWFVVSVWLEWIILYFYVRLWMQVIQILTKKIPKSISRICLHQIGGDCRTWELWCFKSMMKST